MFGRKYVFTNGWFYLHGSNNKLTLCTTIHIQQMFLINHGIFYSLILMALNISNSYVYYVT